MATEEPVTVVETTAAVEVEAEAAQEENPAPKAAKSKKAKEPRARKPPAPRKRGAPTHPPYFEVYLSVCFPYLGTVGHFNHYKPLIASRSSFGFLFCF